MKKMLYAVACLTFLALSYSISLAADEQLSSSEHRLQQGKMLLSQNSTADRMRQQYEDAVQAKREREEKLQREYPEQYRQYQEEKANSRPSGRVAIDPSTGQTYPVTGGGMAIDPSTGQAYPVTRGGVVVR